MRELVGDDVVDRRHREMNQPPIQADRAVSARAAPTRLRRRQAEARIANAELLSKMPAAFLEDAPRLTLQPALHRVADLFRRGGVRQAHVKREPGDTGQGARV